MGIQTIAQFYEARESAQAATNEQVKRSFLEKYPQFDRDCNWPLIKMAIGDRPITVENAELAAEANKTRLAIVSDVDLAAEQQQMADGICATQFTRKFRPSERESWSAKLYAMAQEKRNHFLVSLSRADLKDLVKREAARPAILTAKRASRPAFNSNVILGGKAAYDAAFDAELEILASMDIEELEKVSAPAMSLDEAKADYESRHPEAVGASPVHFGDELKRHNARSEQVEQRDVPDGVVISYTRAELISMNRNEYKRLFMRPNGNGGFEYKPGYAAAIERILHGEMTEGAQLRDQALRNRI